MLWQIVVLLPEFRSGSYILSFAFSMSWNISERSFNGKFFASITSYGTSFSLQPFSSFMSGKFTLTKRLWPHVKSLWRGRWQHSQGQPSSSHIQSQFQHYHLLHFHLLANSLFWLFLFSVTWDCLSLADKEATQLHVLLPVSELNNRCT